MGYQASVLGASGYTGGEILRILAGHTGLQAVAFARSGPGGDLADVHPHLAAVEATAFGPPEEVAASEVDVCFSCLPSGALDPASVGARVLIDLSDDHRAEPDWVYGLTEFARPSIPSASRIANPGCYPTATLLALVPFVKAGAVTGPVIVDAISGVSGAGRKAVDTYLAANLDGGVEAYGTVEHRHVGEIERGLANLGGAELSVSFTPHLAPMARGLLVTARAHLQKDLSDEDALEILSSCYANEPFVHATSRWPATKAVRGSNGAQVSAHVDRRNGWLICSATIDNLGKGAAGQAVQNANLALGLEETAALTPLGVWP
ncbi:MAG: N-acetyl-gamma-glutamyl-phosphate reductase [Actinomycetota bacterium]|jgi:N-acetyl-gamma-glutamyl-phosphate reductase|nr:N-acetyl-gamma-glutamyl-phosphate reductase [Actinomycetota bacterium]